MQKDSLKASQMLVYSDVFLFLPLLFNQYNTKGLNIKDRLLRQDIEKTMGLIKSIEEDTRKTKKKKQKISLNQDYIQGLNNIITQFDYALRIEFKDYLNISNRIEEKENNASVKNPNAFLRYMKQYKELKAKYEASGLLKKRSLLRMRLVSIEAPKEGPSKDDVARRLLKFGLFDYVQRLLSLDSLRPRECVWCKEWFIAKDKRAKTCSPGCKEKNWVKNNGGQIKRKRNQKVYRERRSKG